MEVYGEITFNVVFIDIYLAKNCFSPQYFKHNYKEYV